MALRFFDTRTRQLEEFRPLDPAGRAVKMYTCGPTVYNHAHIGNFRAYIFEDLLQRWLECRGYQVERVMNLTDVDDKTIRGCRESGVPLGEFTQPFKDAFFADLETLRIEPAAHFPNATDHIARMIEMIATLIERDIAYQADDGSVYFRIGKFPTYGQLAHLDLAELRPTGRINNDEYEKESIGDFALWKAWSEADGDVAWESPWGRGRPGWHIECSAMATGLLGPQLDIHCGAVDNIFPHHEAEIAQSESCTGQTFVRHWLHCAHLIVDGQKMAKSAGNFFTLRDLLERGWSGREIRYALLAIHYRQQLNFTFDGLAAARAALARIDASAPTKAYTDVSAAEGAALALYLFAGNVLQQSAGEMQRAAEAGFRVADPPFNLPLALAQLSVYLDPDLADAQRLVGSIYNVYGNYDAARAAFSQIGPASPHFEQAQIEIADSFSKEDRNDEAINVLKSAFRRDEDANEARLTLAGLYASEDAHEEAVKTSAEAIARLGDAPPEDAWRYFVTRAASLIELDRFDEAETDLKRAVDLAPEEAVALNYLGYSWAERGRNLDEAFALIEKAVALRPQSGAIIDSLGWAHYQRGDYEAALPHLEQAASLEPADPTVTDHLGDVYWRLGRKVEARFQWQRSLELEPKERARAATEKKLRSGLEPEKPESDGNS